MNHKRQSVQERMSQELETVQNPFGHDPRDQGYNRTQSLEFLNLENYNALEGDEIKEKTHEKDSLTTFTPELPKRKNTQELENDSPALITDQNIDNILKKMYPDADPQELYERKDEVMKFVGSSVGINMKRLKSQLKQEQIMAKAKKLDKFKTLGKHNAELLESSNPFIQNVQKLLENNSYNQ